MPQTVFHHDVTASYPMEELQNLPGVPVYAARVFASTHPQDVVVLPKETKDYYPWIQEHYDRIGLPVAREVVFGGHDEVRRYPNHDLSVFYFGEAENAVRPDRRWRETAEYLNSKNNIVMLCQELGVGTPRTACISRPVGQDVDLVGLGQTFPFYVKVALSASGFGVWRCEGPEDFNKVVSRLRVPYQVQEALPEGTKFLNVQYETGPQGSPVRGPITFQVLQGNTHSGNSFPTPYDAADIHAVCDPVAKWATEHGMRGVFAFDVAATPDGKFLLIECNPRWNGASYYSRVADKLGVSQWQSLNTGFKYRTFEGLHLPTGLAFSRAHGEGIIIVNWGCAGEGKLGIFVAGQPESRKELIVEFTERFS